MGYYSKAKVSKDVEDLFNKVVPDEVKKLFDEARKNELHYQRQYYAKCVAKKKNKKK
jgi:hypothetical protein